MRKKVFEVLCLYTQSRSEKERKLLGKELIHLLRSPPVQDDIEGHHDMLMNSLALAIRTLLTFQDLKKTPQELAQILESTQGEVEEALSLLVRLQLVEEIKGRYLSRQKHTNIPDKFYNLGMDQFYRRSFQEAQKAINFPKETRRYRSWYAALTEEEFQTFVPEAEGQLRQQILKRDGDQFSGKRLYQVLFSAVPVSK